MKRYNIIYIVVLIHLAISSVFADHFDFTVPSTTSSMVFYGDVFNINGEMSEVGDEIAIFDAQGIMCGHVVVTHPGFFNMSVYGDDNTSQEDEGASIDEELTFKIWDQSDQIEIVLTDSMFVQKQVFSASAIDTIPPRYLGNNEFRGMGIDAVSNMIQYVSLSPTSKTIPVNTELLLSVIYDAIEETSGIGIRIHYSSSNIELLDIESLFSYGLLSNYLETDDSEDIDQDSSTDKCIVVGWAVLSNAWPLSTMPLKLMDLKLKTLKTGTTHINISFSSTTGGCIGVGQNAQISVIPEPNKKPVISNIPDQAIAEGGLFTSIQLDDFIWDEDSSKSEISLTCTGMNALKINIIDHIATITIPHKDWNGSETITFIATDPEGLSANESVVFMVTPVNDQPQFSVIPSQTVDEGGSFSEITLNSYVDDIDGDTDFSWDVSSNYFQVSIENSIATIKTPEENWFGAANIHFTVTDSGGLTATSTVMFTVRSVNDAPKIASIPSQTIDEGCSFTSISLSQYVADVDNHISEISWSASGQSNLQVSIADGIANIGIVDNDWYGTENITFTAIDPGNLTAYTVVSFIVNPINDAPLVIDIPGQTINEGEAFASISLDYFVNDDHTREQITWTCSGENELTVTIQNRVANIQIPHEDWVGKETITFIATDPLFLSDFTNVSFVVNPINDHPVLSDIQNQEILEGSSFTSISLDDYIDDIETSDADISWSYTGNHELSISIINRIASITIPGPDWYGVEIVTFTATDGDGETASDSVTLTVTAVNDPPVVLDIQNQSTPQNTNFENLILDNYVSDIDNSPNEMTWRVKGENNLLVSINDGIVSISVRNSKWYGSETLDFIVMDPEGLTAQRAVTFEVTQLNNLQPPDNLDASEISNGIQLKWKPLSDFSIKYSVYRSQIENGLYYPIHSVLVDAYDMITNGFVDINIKSNNSYFYRVKSCKDELESDSFSNTAKITVTDTSDFNIQFINNAHQILPKGGTVTYDLIISKKATFKGQLSLWCNNMPQSIQYQILVNGEDKGTRADEIQLLPATITIQLFSRSSAIVDNYQFELQCVNFDGAAGNIQKSWDLGLTIVHQSGICIDVNKHIIHRGKTNTIYGAIYPPLKSQHIQLTAFSNNVSYHTQKIYTQAGGIFSDENWIKNFEPGQYTIQASWQDTSFIQRTAESRPIIIKKQLPMITCAPGQNKRPTIDEDFTITGMFHSELSYAPVTMKIFSPDGSNDQTVELYTDANGNFRTSQPFFNQNGLWTFKAYFMGNDSAIGCESDAYELLVGNNGCAIIVGGGEASIQNTYWEVTKQLVVEAYQDFKRMGFLDDMIHLMINSQMIDINNDDIPDNVVDTAIPTANALTNVIQNEYTSILNENDTLYIYMQGHGSSNSKFKILGSDEYISSTQLNDALTIFQQRTGSQIVLIMESCYSGLFVKDLSHDKRIIITSAGDEPYNTDASGRISLSRYFFSRICQGDSIEKAFNYASHQLINKQFPAPLLDDNGDGISTMFDGMIAGLTYLPGILSWGRPEISNIDLNPVLDNQTSLDVQLTVESRADEIQKVWAQVIPPDAAISSGTQTISFPETELLYDQNNMYKGSIPNFSYDGTYTVLFYAENMDNEISDPEQVLVRVTNVGRKKDFDGDNQTTLKDLIIVLKSLSGINVLPDVGMIDAIVLIQYLNGEIN